VAKRTASAKKQVRAGVRRAARNRGVKSEVKTLVVKARKSLVGAPVAESERYALTLEAVRALDRAASKGILHRNNAARRKARLTKLMAKVAIATPAASGPVGRAKKGGATATATAAVAAAPAAAKPAAKPAASKKK
jgi:small subunit ribosomal protein S20